MTTIITTAPDAYDYGWTTPVESDVRADILCRACNDDPDTDYIINRAMKDGKDIRVVEVEAEHAEYQRGRYLSGMYMAVMV